MNTKFPVIVTFAVALNFTPCIARAQVALTVAETALLVMMSWACSVKRSRPNSER